MRSQRPVRELTLAFIAIGVWTVSALGAAPAEKKKDLYDLTEIVAVQNRAYDFRESLGLGAGYLPSDTFNRGFGVGGFYTYQINDRFAWEALKYNYIINQETQTKKDVVSQGFAISAGNGGVLDYPVHIATTGVVFTPIYNKGLAFNKNLIYSEIAFYLGAGVAIFNQTGNRYLLTPGIQGRFYFSPQYALLAHFRDHFYNDSHQGIDNMIDVGIAFEMQLNIFTKKSPEGSP